MDEARWLNRTLCIDTGCAVGGALTALRWPERELIAVRAARQYAMPPKPLAARGERSPVQRAEDLLFFDDYTGKRRVETRFGAPVLIPEQNALAALETLSRFGIDPRWLVYVPPTMAPAATAPEGSCLEHPDQACQYFASRGLTDVVAEEKHMGSRALIVVAKDVAAARSRFGVDDGKAGVVYTRTGRPFFRDEAQEAQVVARIGAAMGSTGIWSTLESDWALVDAEVMPWSAKAGDLLRSQYSPTAAGARASAEALLAAVDRASGVSGLDALKTSALRRRENAIRMGRTIDGYCWNASSVDDYRIAPFHLLAAEGKVLTDRSHAWHMETIESLAAVEPVIRATPWRRFDPAREPERASVASWWTDLTARGGEGMVLKPNIWTHQADGRFVQPALKVRGREYLRIIYGPDYDEPANIERLRQRGTGRKRSLATREYQLGMEGLHRFVERRPLAEVHDCALAVLALESEPVDPRL